MKKLATITLLCLTLTVVSEIAYAQQDGFGIGAMINGPDGISYKAWINEDMAVAGAVTFNIGDFSSFYTHADVLVHNNNRAQVDLESGMLRMYYGGGVRLRFDDFNDETYFGLRAPIGTNYQFEEVPVDIFFELVPTLLFNDTEFGFNGALGFRYFVN